MSGRIDNHVGIMPWVEREISRIDALSDLELAAEVRNAMNRTNYSWQTINQRLQQQGINRDIYREWNVLCDMRRDWEMNRPFKAGATLCERNLWDPDAHRVILNNLKVIPVCAGLGVEAVILVTTNVDISSNITIQDLWVDGEKWSLGYLDNQWEESTIDEEEPLLGRFHDVEHQRGFWRSLRKLFP